MDAHEREVFWNTLCSLPGKDIKTESETLAQTLKMPKLLFRYRPINTKSLEALRTNKLFFSTADYYDDPFDTFLNINIDEIRNFFSSAFESPENITAIIDVFKLIFHGTFSKEELQQITAENLAKALSQGLIESFLNFALALRNGIKKEIWSVCFSENGFNETLWLKYADQYKGFVQIYDLENDENFLCGKQDKCKNVGLINMELFSIQYIIHIPHIMQQIMQRQSCFIRLKNKQES